MKVPLPLSRLFYIDSHSIIFHAYMYRVFCHKFFLLLLINGLLTCLRGPQGRLVPPIGSPSVNKVYLLMHSISKSHHHKMLLTVTFYFYIDVKLWDILTHSQIHVAGGSYSDSFLIKCKIQQHCNEILMLPKQLLPQCISTCYSIR